MPAFLLRLSTLQRALIVSLTVHAALLSVRFADPARFDRVFQDTPLEVVLVNARSDEVPDKAQAIAQAQLAGGGDAQEGRATSPMPYASLNANGDDFEQMEEQMRALHKEQMQLLAHLRAQLAQLPPPPDPRTANPYDSTQSEQEAKRRQLIKLLAEIEKRINEENARPKKRYISPATREQAYAIYYDALRRKIEDKGTENFPEQGGRKLYGELVMVVSIDSDGSVLETEVVQGSGNALLDRRAQAIARAAGPFGPFTDEMRQRAEQIAIVSRFKFTRENTLEAASGDVIGPSSSEESETAPVSAPVAVPQ